MRNPIAHFNPKRYPLGDLMQGFGENPELYSKSVCYAGSCLAGHNGIDIYRWYGEPILAVADGIIGEIKEESGGYGKHIRLLIDGYEITYGHLSKITCLIGQQVKAGDKIGEMGNTGFIVSGSTPFWKYNPYAGTHLHFGVRKIKIVPIQEADLHYANSTIHVRVENYQNGYFGAIDPMTVLSFDMILPCEKGDFSENVGMIQDLLIKNGYMNPLIFGERGYYGRKTCEAIFKLQQEKLQLSWYERYILKGSVTGTKTVAALNSLISTS